MDTQYQADITFQNKKFLPSDLKFQEFDHCTFRYCNFTEADFLGTVFVDCEFHHCNFEKAPINYVSLRDVEFFYCNFTSVNFAMTDQVLYSFNFNHCQLDYAQFYALKLKKIIFAHCSLISADFMETDLSQAIFDECDLHQAVFVKTNLTSSDFYSSRNFVIDPEKNKIKGALFSKENIKGLLVKYQIKIK
jgi:uncharacterized protein YjbI with pentapeptide repeats